MSTAMFSRHLPDIDLITSVAEKQDSIIARLSPWTRLVLLSVVVLLVVVTGSITVLAALYMVILLLCLTCRLPVRKILSWSVLPALLVLSLVSIMAWTEPGIPVISETVVGHHVVLTLEGINLVAMLLLKTLVSVAASLAFVLTTRYSHLSALASRLLPYPLDQIFLLAYRFLSLTFAMAGSMLKAVQSRGGGLVRSIRHQWRMFFAVFALVFLRSFEHGERVSRSMSARGYSGRLFAATEVAAPALPEYALIFILACVIIFAAAAGPGGMGWLP